MTSRTQAMPPHTWGVSPRHFWLSRLNVQAALPLMFRAMSGLGRKWSLTVGRWGSPGETKRAPAPASYTATKVGQTPFSKGFAIKFLKHVQHMSRGRLWKSNLLKSPSSQVSIQGFVAWALLHPGLSPKAKMSCFQLKPSNLGLSQ